MTLETRIAAIDARIDSLRDARQHLKAQRARKRDKHQSTAGDDAKMQSMTLAQLRAELGAARMRYRQIQHVTGPGARQKAAACRDKARKISERMKEKA